jgi:hypothetical protein
MHKAVSLRMVDLKCCICGGPIGGTIGNAEPVKDGLCCDDCHIMVVIPAGLAGFVNHNSQKEKK